MSKKIKILFTLSLMLNVILLGAGIGLANKMMRPFGDFKKDISKDGRDILRQSFNEAREAMREDHKKAQELKKNMEAVLDNTVFDEAAYDKAIDDILDQRDATSRKRAESAKATLKKLPYSDRRRVGRMLVDRLQGKPMGFHPKKMGEHEKRHGESEKAE